MTIKSITLKAVTRSSKSFNKISLATIEAVDGKLRVVRLGPMHGLHCYAVYSSCLHDARRPAGCSCVLRQPSDLSASTDLAGFATKLGPPVLKLCSYKCLIVWATALYIARTAESHRRRPRIPSSPEWNREQDYPTGLFRERTPLRYAIYRLVQCIKLNILMEAANALRHFGHECMCTQE